MNMHVKVIGVKDYGRILQVPGGTTLKGLINWASFVYKEALDRKDEFNPGRKILLQFEQQPNITLTLEPNFPGEYKVFVEPHAVPTDLWRF